MSESIWLVGREDGTDEDGRYDITYVPDPDYGWFPSREETQRFIDTTFGPALEKYERRLAEYQRECAAWNEKNDELRKVGGRNAATYPSRPMRPNLHEPIEVERGLVSKGGA